MELQRNNQKGRSSRLALPLIAALPAAMLTVLAGSPPSSAATAPAGTIVATSLTSEANTSGKVRVGEQAKLHVSVGQYNGSPLRITLKGVRFDPHRVFVGDSTRFCIPFAVVQAADGVRSQVVECQSPFSNVPFDMDLPVVGNQVGDYTLAGGLSVRVDPTYSGDLAISIDDPVLNPDGTRTYSATVDFPPEADIERAIVETVASSPIAMDYTREGMEKWDPLRKGMVAESDRVSIASVSGQESFTDTLVSPGEFFALSVRTEWRELGGTDPDPSNNVATAIFRIAADGSAQRVELPIPSNVTLEATQGTPLTIPFDELTGGNNLQVLYSEPLHGSLALDGEAFTYTPLSGFAGIDIFLYQVNIPSPSCASCPPIPVTGIATINVAPKVTPIRAGTLHVATLEDLPVTISRDDLLRVVTVDPNVSVDESSLAAVPTITRGSGTLQPLGDGGWVYTPAANHHAIDPPDQLRITVRDTAGYSDDLTVNVTVSPVNDAPTVVLSGPVRVPAGSTQTYSYTVDDPDVGDGYSVKNASCGANGTVVEGSLTDGTFRCQFAEGPMTSSTASIEIADNGDARGTASMDVALTWHLPGFQHPVDANTVNVVKGGSTVPLKFEVFAGSTELVDPALVTTFTARALSCATLGGLPEDPIEAYDAGNTSLRYEDGVFIQNWKTPRTSSQCYRLTLTTDDGSTLSALFRIK